MLDATSCLEEKGGSGSAVRCDTTLAAGGKHWFPYGVPSSICADNLSGTPENGPFCAD